MSYKIILDSCGELPPKYKADERFEIVSLGIEVGDYQIMDDENSKPEGISRKGGGMPEMPEIFLPFPGELYGSMPLRCGSCVYRNPVF